MTMQRANVSIPVIYLKEGEAVICYSPAFDLVAHGDSLEDAETSFAQTLTLFIDEVTRMGTWKALLQESGWRKINNQWSPPVFLQEKNTAVEIPIDA
jgi:predicted RNase H-like HicB family nuclease